jgi:hypothetical protein
MNLRSLSSLGRHATTDLADSMEPRYRDSRGSVVTVSVVQFVSKKRFNASGDLMDLACIRIVAAPKLYSSSDVSTC